MSFRSTLYGLLRVLNDINAVQKGKVGNRIKNKGMGRVFGKRLYGRGKK